MKSGVLRLLVFPSSLVSSFPILNAKAKEKPPIASGANNKDHALPPPAFAKALRETEGP
jgi:hypothetical protein